MDDRNVIEHRINTDFLIEINRFCNSDKDITNCRLKLDDEVFRHEWFVALFKEGEPFFQLGLFNKPFFKTELRRFYLEAHDFLSRFGFLGYYHYKDIGAWVAHVSRHKGQQQQQVKGESEGEVDEDEEDDVVEREMMLEENILERFPFGVIPVGMTPNHRYGQYILVENRETMRKTIVFEPCEDEDRGGRMVFRVINKWAEFVPMVEYTMRHRIDVNLVGNDVVPTTQFASLYLQERHIREATKMAFDSNSLNIYPEGFVIDKPQKDAALDDVPDTVLYGLDNILNAKQTDNRQREDEGADNARYHAQRIAMKRNVANSRQCGLASQQYGGGSVNLIRNQQLMNDRPSRYEKMDYIPRTVELQGGTIGKPVLEVERLEHKYENDVCKAMKVPYSFINPYTSSSSVSSSSKSDNGGKRTNGAIASEHNDRNQKLLEKEVKEQHALFTEIFSEVYRHTFARLDIEMFRLRSDRDHFVGLMPGIYFDHVLVKSEAALQGLKGYYELGLVPEDEMKRVVFNEYNIQLPTDIEAAHIAKKRKIRDIPIHTLLVDHGDVDDDLHED